MKESKKISLLTQAVTFLKQCPIHLILLPLFFILSIYVQLAGLLYTNEVLTSFFRVAVFILILFVILLFVYKNKTKAGVVSTIAGTLYLFFGNIKDMLSATPLIKYISSYTILLFVLPAAVIYFLYRIRKARSLENLTLFLNILFLLYLGLEVWKWQELRNYRKKNNQVPIQLVSSKEKLPDIYYILFDCYPSSRYQEEVLGAYPNFLDSSLKAKGFHILNHSKSNYAITSFSVASTLQMQYLDWIKENAQAKPEHYIEATSAVKQSVVFDLLNKNGYQLYNLSIFDLPGHPSVNKERFFGTASEEIIYYNTLWGRIKWQVLPALWPSYLKKLEALQKKNNKTLVGKFKAYNQQMLDSLQLLPSLQHNVSPKFIYAHFEMPHYPYFYDSTGKAFPEDEVFSSTMATDKKRFSNYIAYTNKAAISIVNAILAENANSIIILQSDHGTKNLDAARPGDAFTNYSSFYFPDRDYHTLYDSMSNVNTFRIILNKYFHQQLALLPDSSIHIND